MKAMPASAPADPATALRTSGPERFFQAVYERFALAEARAGAAVEHTYAIAGYSVRLRFAGPALAPFIIPALEHLACQGSHKADLTVCLWDTASTGVTPPPPPWTAYDYLDRGAIRGYNTERIRTAYFVGPGVLCMLDLQENLALYWLRDAQAHPVYMTGSPLLTILHWWMEAHERQLVHGGAVGTAAGGVLLAGKGGSGKSTTSLACLFSDLSYLADDYCLVDTAPPYTAYSLFNSGKINARSQKLLPELGQIAANGALDFAGKSLLFVHQHFPDKIISRFPLRAVLLPRIAGGAATRVKPVSEIQALHALAPSTIFQLSGAGSRQFQRLAQMTRHIPAFGLELGAEVQAIPQIISGLLEEV